MKLKPVFLLLSTLCLQNAAQAVSFDISPAAVSNTYAGFITLQINGLTNGETVTVQKYLDANSNGVVDSADWLVQQFQVTDGQSTVIGGATNINVPFDSTPVDGAITSALNLAGEGGAQRLVAPYLFVLSSPTGRWAPLTNRFTVTNAALGQSVTGLAQCNGTNVPFALVLLSYYNAASAGFTPVGGALANVSGAFTIAAPPASYQLFGFTTSLLANTSVSPFTLSAGVSVSNNVALIASSQTISGQMVDASSGVGLPGILMAAMLKNGGQAAFGATGSNGNFTVPAVPNGGWQIGMDQQSVDTLGYVTPNSGSKISTTSGSVSGVSVPLPKGTAGFYGKVVDGGNDPLADVRLEGENGSSESGSGPWQGDATSDPNGNYFMAVVAGNWDDEVDVVSSGPAYASFIFSQSPFGYNNGNDGTNMTAGLAVLQNFTGFAATHYIAGTVMDNNNNPISGVGVIATAAINGVVFTTQTVDTGSNGQYSINVGNGYWDVSLNCCPGCGGDSLPSIYQCPNSQFVGITNGNGAADFTVETYGAFVSGRVVTQTGSPVTNINVFAFPNGGSGSTGQGTTDANGNFQLGVNPGNYVIELDTGSQSGTPSLGLVSPSIPITVANGANISNLILIALAATGSIDASITNSTLNMGVSGINVSGGATINGTNYQTGTQATEKSGQVTLVVCNGGWDVSVDCGGLSDLGDSCPSDQFLTIANNTLAANFLVTGGASAPSLGSPSWHANQFQLQVNGSTGQSYTVQFTTNLASTNWTFLFSTNNTQNASFSITDPNATNKQRFYRVLTSP